jgi:rhodanese-related sulfurtransferase
MATTLPSRFPVTEHPPAEPDDAVAHFQALLRFETDCWDVHEELATGAPTFVLLDVRGPAGFAAGHVPGARNLPHGKINERNLAEFGPGTVFVTYCNGPHCNGADKAAVKLARLGRPVKKMIGGIEGWKDEGFELEQT